MRTLCILSRKGWSVNNELQKICSKSNSFTFYRFPGMHNQVETQKKGSQGTAIHENSSNNCCGGWSENNELQRICSKSNSITFYRYPGMLNQVEKQKEGSQETSIHENSIQYLLWEVVWKQWVLLRILMNWSPLGPFLLCFYLIAHPRGPIERDRIGFGANLLQLIVPRPPLSANIA